MKRNSTTVFIESTNAVTPRPWLNSEPDFTGIEEPYLSALLNAWTAFLVSGQELEIIADPIPYMQILQPNWDALQASLLGGELYFIYQRIRAASFAASSEGVLQASNISTALGFITDGILTVRVEAAVAEAIGILRTIGYVFTQEEQTSWNTKIAELNFSNLMNL